MYKSRHSEIGAVRSSGSGLSSSSTENVTNLKGIKHYEELTTQEIPKTIHQTCPREEIKDKCAFGVNRMQSTLCTFDSNESDTDQSPETEIQEDYSHKIREQSSDQHESEADFECHQNPGQFNDTCVSDSESQPAETVILDNEKQTDIEQTIDQGQYEDDSSEKLLIKFLKMQENTLLDDLLLDLNQNNKWDVNDETNYVGQVVDDEDAADPIIEEVNEKDPVSPGHWLSLQTSVLLIWMYAITHSITSSQLSDLITLINLHLVIAHPVFSSLYRFKNFFANTKLPSESLKHYYCCHCTASVSVNTEVCPNNLCRKPLDRSKLNYFLELNVQSQLKNMFSRKDFLDGLKHRFNRFKKKKENIEDVYDSENYKALFYNNGPLSDENNLSFIFNTDGVPIFKSSKTSVWPIFLMINELPYKMRKCREFMLLAGLWCGPTKPAMNLFLSPLQKSLTELERGITVCKNGEEVITRAFLFGISCDLPARSAVLNMNNHNGECSCIKCNQKGENYRTQKGGNIRTFPYIIDNPGGPARDHDTIIQHAFSASESTSSHINGIKGPSVVMFCPEFDVVKGTAIDYMHLVCLGIVRLLLNLWFNVSNSLKHFSMYQYVNVVDSRLTNFKPPHYITRQPRSISEHLKFWKAAELRAWLFYYSIPCISDLLHPTYLYHYCAFVEAIYLLCQSSISEHDLEKSQKLLQYFVLMMPSLYDQRYVTLNAHSLLHLPQTVKDLSPLWSNSCFSFEGANGELLKMFHGTQHIDLQIVNAVHVFQLLPSIADTIPFENTPALKFVKSLQKEDQQQDNVDQFSFCGKGYEKHLSQACKQLLGSFLNGNISILKFYSRAYVRKVMFHSKDYIRISKRNSYSVKFINNGSLNYGFILWFAEHIPDGYEEGRQKFACVEKLIMKDGFSKMFDTNVDGTLPDKQTIDNFMDIKLPNMVQLVPEGVQCFIPLENILELCICLETDKSITFCEEPNYHEKNL